MPKGRLFVVAGPSGAGKGTLIAELRRRHPGIWLSVSATTRKPRAGEKDGEQYYFLSEEDFREKASRGEFLEWAEVHGNLYGTPRARVEEELERGRDVVLEIDVQGARQVRSRQPQAVSIFILPPSMQVLEERLRLRGTEEEDELRRRLRKAEEECGEGREYSYVVVNDELDRAARELCAIYVKESLLEKADREDNGR